MCSERRGALGSLTGGPARGIGSGVNFPLADALESLFVRSGLSPAQVMREVERLSAAYGRGEPRAIDGENAALAYALYFLPEHFLKPYLVVSELLALGAFTSGKRLSVVDAGAGPGTATWAVVEALRAAGDNRRVDAILIDRSPSLLKTAATIAGRYEGRVSITTLQADMSTASIPSADVVFLCNALSEIYEEESRMAVLKRALSSAGGSGAVVVLEPDSTRGADVAAALWSSFGSQVVAPCPAPHAFDIAVPVPAALQRVVTARHRRQKFHWAVLSNAPPAARQDLFRIAEPFKKLKWGCQAAVCGARGIENIAIRSRRLEDRRALEALGQGDLVGIDAVRSASGGFKLESAGPITVVHSFAAPARLLAG